MNRPTVQQLSERAQRDEELSLRVRNAATSLNQALIECAQHGLDVSVIVESQGRALGSRVQLTTIEVNLQRPI